METSLYLARLIGPFLVLTALPVFVDPRGLEALGREFVASRALLFLAGMLSLVAGIAILNVHNVWVAGWPVVITLLGWLALAAGIVRTAFPGIVAEFGDTLLANRTAVVALTVVQVALGLGLCWVGYV